MDKNAYRRQLGLVLQDPFLFSGTIKDNIRYGNIDADDEKILAAAKTVGADEFIMRLDKGYDTELQERGQNLSMGQRSLLGFARHFWLTRLFCFWMKLLRASIRIAKLSFNGDSTIL